MREHYAAESQSHVEYSDSQPGFNLPQDIASNLDRSCNSVQGATASLASTACVALWNL
jgi:hypothetical protein